MADTTNQPDANQTPFYDPTAFDVQGSPQTSNVQLAKPAYPKHVFTSFFHIAFKVASILTYVFAQWVLRISFVIVFITTVIFIAADFWVTKNISGRLMAGLRWWNEIKPDGSSVWIFESLETKANINPHESKVFWLALLVAPVVWVVFGIVAAIGIKIEWTVLCIMAVALTGANLVGYIKCARGITFLSKLLIYALHALLVLTFLLIGFLDARAKLKGAAKKMATEQAIKHMTNM